MQHHFDNSPAPSDEHDPVEGFDAEFSSVVDYIIRITYRIWEGKQIGLVYDYYSDDCPIYTLAGYAEGAEAAVQGTIKTLSAFPDRTLHAENIIYSGDNDSGYHSSHLIWTQMTNLGDSEFGPATGKSAQIRVIAHCVMKDNKIVEEWLVRDNYSLVEQLGFDPDEVAQRWAQTPIAPESQFAKWRDSEIARVMATDTSRQANLADPQLDAGAFVKTHLHNIWNNRMLGDMHLLYVDNVVFHGSANREFNYKEQVLRYYLDFLGAMPDGKMALDKVCVVQNSVGGHDVSVRWAFAGTHTGNVRFGAPTGQPILVIGESQYRLKAGKVVEEWTVFDELSILTQMHRHRLSAQAGAAE
jgi:predicted ester cyclase